MKFQINMLRDLRKIEAENNLENTSEHKFRIYDFNDPFDLRYTKIIAGQIGGESSGGSWRHLLDTMLDQLLLQGKNTLDISSVIDLNIRQGFWIEGGFMPIGEGEYSRKRIDTNKSAKAILLLARQYDISVEISYYWINKVGKAAFPSEFGKLLKN